MSNEKQSAITSTKNQLLCSSSGNLETTRSDWPGADRAASQDASDRVGERIKESDAAADDGIKSDSERACDRWTGVGGDRGQGLRSASANSVSESSRVSSSSSSSSKLESFRTVCSARSSVGAMRTALVQQSTSDFDEGPRQQQLEVDRQEHQNFDRCSASSNQKTEQRVSECQILSASNLLLVTQLSSQNEGTTTTSTTNDDCDRRAAAAVKPKKVAPIEREFENEIDVIDASNELAQRLEVANDCESVAHQAAMSVSSSFRYCGSNSSNNNEIIISELETGENYPDNEPAAATTTETMPNFYRAKLAPTSQQGSCPYGSVGGRTGVGFTDVQPKLTFASKRMKEYFESFKSSHDRRRRYESSHLYQFFKATRTELVACLLFSLIVCYTLICCRVSSSSLALISLADQPSSPLPFKAPSPLASSLSSSPGSSPEQQAQELNNNNNSNNNKQQQQPSPRLRLAPSSASSALQVHLITGLVASVTVATLTQVVGHVSGCHLIPSISLALYFKGHISRARLISYLAAQSLGSLLGVALLGLLTSSQVTTLERVSSATLGETLAVVSPVTTSPSLQFQLGLTPPPPVTQPGAHRQQPPTGSLLVVANNNWARATQASPTGERGPLGSRGAPIELSPSLISSGASASSKERNNNNNDDDDTSSSSKKPKLMDNIERRRRKKRSSSSLPEELVKPILLPSSSSSSSSYGDGGFGTEGSETILVAIMEQKERQLNDRLVAAAHSKPPASLPAAASMGPSNNQVVKSSLGTLETLSPGRPAVSGPPVPSQSVSLPAPQPLASSSSSSSSSSFSLPPSPLAPNQMAPTPPPHPLGPNDEQQQAHQATYARVQIKTSNPGDDDEIKLKLFGATNDTRKAREIAPAAQGALESSSFSSPELSQRLPLATSSSSPVLLLPVRLAPSELKAGASEPLTTTTTTTMQATRMTLGGQSMAATAGQKMSDSGVGGGAGRGSGETTGPLNLLLASAPQSSNRGPQKALDEQPHERTPTAAVEANSQAVSRQLVMVPIHDEFTTTTISSHYHHHEHNYPPNTVQDDEMPRPPVRQQDGPSPTLPIRYNSSSLKVTTSSSASSLPVIIGTGSGGGEVAGENASVRPKRNKVKKRRHLKATISTQTASDKTGNDEHQEMKPILEASSAIATSVASNQDDQRSHQATGHHQLHRSEARVINLLEFALPEAIMSSDSIEKCLAEMNENNENIKQQYNNYPAVSPCLSRSNGSQMFIFQLLATLLVNLTYLTNVDPRRTDLGYKSLSIGLAYFLAHLLTLNSGGFNGQPFQLAGLIMLASSASSPGPVSSLWQTEWLIYLLVPLIGGLFSALSHEYIDFTSAKNRAKQLHLRRSFFSLDNLSGAGGNGNANTNRTTNSSHLKLANDTVSPQSSMGELEEDEEDDGDCDGDEEEVVMGMGMVDCSPTGREGNSRRPTTMTRTITTKTAERQQHKVTTNNGRPVAVARGARARQRIASMGNCSIATTSSLYDDENGNGLGPMKLNTSELGNNIGGGEGEAPQRAAAEGPIDGPNTDLVRQQTHNHKHLEKSLSSSGSASCYSRQVKLERERLKQVAECRERTSNHRSGLATRDLNNNNNSASAQGGSILFDSNFLISSPTATTTSRTDNHQRPVALTNYHHKHSSAAAASDGSCLAARRGRSNSGSLFESYSRYFANSFSHQYQQQQHTDQSPFQLANGRPHTSGVGQICTSQFM